MNLLKHYTLNKILCSTMQGLMVLGYDNNHNRQCVIKQAQKQLVHSYKTKQGTDVDEDFLNEVQILTIFTNMNDSHPNIIKGIEVFDDQHSYYLVMEKCDIDIFQVVLNSKMLAENVSQSVQISSEHQTCIKYDSPWIKNFVKPLFRQIVHCVAWMHSHGYCHSDLSLENVMLLNPMLTPAGTPESVRDLLAKIIDLGLAKYYGQRFVSKRKVGKTKYMSPEANLRQIYDPRLNDVYSLGVMLFMMLVQVPPYKKPQIEDHGFNCFINGKIPLVLTSWKLLSLVTEEALDLLMKVFRWEKDGRITMAQLLKHPFLNTVVHSDEDYLISNNSNNNNNNNNTGTHSPVSSLSPTPEIFENVQSFDSNPLQAKTGDVLAKKEGRVQPSAVNIL